MKQQENGALLETAPPRNETDGQPQKITDVVETVFRGKEFLFRIMLTKMYFLVL